MDKNKTPSYVYVQNPQNPSEQVKARIVNFKPSKGMEPMELELEDGNILRVFFTVTAVSQPLKENGEPLTNPSNKKPYYTVNYNISLTPIFKG
jgi:hypothetical protein